jgi:hypothetical protein
VTASAGERGYEVVVRGGGRQWRETIEEGALRAAAPAIAERAGDLALPGSRFELRLAHPELAALDWEGNLPPGARVIRTTLVPARALAVPLALPLRVLGVDEHVDVVAGRGFETATCPLDALPQFRHRSDWPGADVVLLRWPWQWPEPGDDLLCTSRPESPGTLGWHERWLTTLQTRLVVIVAPHERERADARRLAAALVERGGPAVFVTDHGAAVEPVIEAAMHDVSLDREALRPHTSAFLGAGREDALRLAPVEERLETLRKPHRAPMRWHVPALRKLRPRFAPGPSLDMLATAVEQLRREYNDPGPRRTVRRHRRRAVEVSLRDRHGRPPAGPLGLGVPAQVRVGAGDLDELRGAAAGASVLAELHLPGADDSEGRWLEVGLVGLDCDVIGDSVQAMWLPAEGIGVPAIFAVVPHEPGRMHVRVCIYADSHLLQSLMVTAAVGRFRGPLAARAARSVRRRPAAPRVTLEYARARDMAGIISAPGRTLSIVANDRAGTPMISIKGADIHGTSSDASAGSRADEVRAALDEIATPGQGNPAVDRIDLRYGFDQDNIGDPMHYDRAMVPLADAGWALYEAAIPQSQREAVAKVLAAGGTIQAAHLRLAKVMPWAGMYDRPFNRRRTADAAGRRIRFAGCPAPLAAGRFDPQTPCGEHLDCLLHPDNLEHAEGVHVEASVACPVHFWGFRNVIEVAPFQAEDGQTATPAATIGVGARPSITVGVHAGLQLQAAHMQTLQSKLGAAVDIVGPEYDHNRLLDLLIDGEPDLVYLYCHQDGGVETGVDPPILRFQAPNCQAEGHIVAGDLSAPTPWSHRPFVILNGCRTAAYRPDALSPFIITLMQDRGASGLLGTEIPVWEQLATHVGTTILEAMVGGQAAGTALLAVRQDLMAKRNPLGLAYTLYAPAELALARR